jgi:predicted nucleic acid-binding protein
MIVVSNTSPITSLAAIGQFELLQESLYRQVLEQAGEMKKQ